MRDEVEPCVYLEERSARLPLRWQLAPCLGEDLDRSLALGERRVGQALYRPKCPDCRACETLRIPVEAFRPSRTQRRIWRRGKEAFEVQSTAPTLSTEHVELFNRHRLERGLDARAGALDAAGYRSWLVQTCCETVELRYLLDGALAAVALVDVGATASSAVYTYFDPDASRLSPGIFSVLWQIEWARSLGLRYHYLGLYVEGNAHMAYKTCFRPHERRPAGEPAGEWRLIER